MDFLLVVVIIILVILATFIYAGFRGAPWVPTKNGDVERFLRLAELKPGAVVYDLGCGDGRIVRVAAQAGAAATGFELSLLPYCMAKLRLMSTAGQVRFNDFWHADLRDADVVYFFLMPGIYSKLKTKLENELKPGAKVIAYVWPVEGWEPAITDHVSGSPDLHVYVRP
ncbi:MAG: hypothetical protein AAB579_01270 [Patescibacteria group bacterium]